MIYGGAGLPQNYGLLEKKQAQWHKDIDIMLGRRFPDTTHHEEFPSAYRTTVRPPPPPPRAACLRPRRQYALAEKEVPCGDKELCITCGDPPTNDTQEDQVASVPCADHDGLLAI